METLLMDELLLLLTKVHDSEDFVRRAEEFFNEHHREWADDLAIAFEIFLERKRDQIFYEKDRALRVGTNIALGRQVRDEDI